MSENPHVDGPSLPFPQTPSASVAGRTLAESEHHWRQDPQRLPEDAPNIVIFMSDDAGFSNPDTFGGPVHTPTLTRLAEAGDAAYVDEMRFGYFVRAATEDGFTVKFDDLAIWLIEEE